MQKEFSGVFSSTKDSFEGTLHIKEGRRMYQALPRYEVYGLQKSCKEEWEWLQW